MDNDDKTIDVLLDTHFANLNDELRKNLCPTLTKDEWLAIGKVEMSFEVFVAMNKRIEQQSRRIAELEKELNGDGHAQQAQ